MDPQQETEMRFCVNCINRQGYLRERIEREGERETCTYCNRIVVAPSWNLATLASKLQERFQEYFSYDPTDKHTLEELIFCFTRPIHAHKGRTIKEKIINYIISSWKRNDPQNKYQYSPDARYSGSIHKTPRHDEAYKQAYEHNNSLWKKFEYLTKHEAGLFNAEAEKLLEDIFPDIIPRDMQGAGFKPYIETIDTNSKFWRARRFDRNEEAEKALKNPHQELGPPPPDIASAGRMNPRGISVFYGAMEPETALAEIRPPVGSFVLIGQFQPARPLKVLVITHYLSTNIDIWDDQLPQKLAREDFIGYLFTQIARPILPADTDLDYIPTQVFAEYCVCKGLDGVKFCSAQNPAGWNVILFRHAARVAMPNGHAETEEDHQEPSLELIEGSVRKIEITGVHFTTSPSLTSEAQA